MPCTAMSSERSSRICVLVVDPQITAAPATRALLSAQGQGGTSRIAVRVVTAEL